jgi:1,4-dihydroxy-2-naphthoate octaprenyltransferase
MHSAALVLALSFLGIGLACAFFLLRTQLASVVLVLSIAALAWTYSAPPIRLHSRGVGELAAAVVVAALVPWLGCAVQRGGPSSLALAAVLPLVLIQFAMLLVIGVPDRRGDACVGKRTLVVRLGVRDSATLHNVALVTAYVFMTVLWALGLSANVMAAFVVTAPLACLQLARVAKGHFHDARHWEGLAFGSVALVLLSALAELVGFLNAT